MFNTILVIMALAIGGMLGIKKGFSERGLLHYMDAHPDPRWVPKTAYYVGNTLLLFNNLTESTTYFGRVMENYPDSPYADDAHAQYLSAIDLMPGIDRAKLIEENEKYLEHFPEGKHAELIRNRIDIYKNPR